MGNNSSQNENKYLLESESTFLDFLLQSISQYPKKFYLVLNNKIKWEFHIHCKKDSEKLHYCLRSCIVKNLGSIRIVVQKIHVDLISFSGVLSDGFNFWLTIQHMVGLKNKNILCSAHLYKKSVFSNNWKSYGAYLVYNSSHEFSEESTKLN